jgi:hypothetical protein
MREEGGGGREKVTEGKRSPFSNAGLYMMQSFVRNVFFQF